MISYRKLRWLTVSVLALYKYLQTGSMMTQRGSSTVYAAEQQSEVGLSVVCCTHQAYTHCLLCGLPVVHVSSSSGYRANCFDLG